MNEKSKNIKFPGRSFKLGNLDNVKQYWELSHNTLLELQTDRQTQAIYL